MILLQGLLIELMGLKLLQKHDKLRDEKKILYEMDATWKGIWMFTDWLISYLALM